MVLHESHPLPTYPHPEDVLQCAAAATVEAQEPGNRQPVMAGLPGPASLPLTWSRRCCLSPADPERHANNQTSDQGARSRRRYEDLREHPSATTTGGRDPSPGGVGDPDGGCPRNELQHVSGGL